MPLALTVVTPEGQAFDGAAESVVLPGAEGDFGVLPGHEVFLTALQNGAMTIDTGSERLFAALSRGFAEVHEDAVTVMVGNCEFAHEIDQDRARLAAERARAQLEALRDSPEGEAMIEEYQDQYTRAVARLAVSEKR